jgi:hypothetical protein
MNKGYNEIRETCKLVDYVYKLAAKCALWIEIYQDDTHEYRALFSPNSTSQFPLTITKVLLNEPQRFDYS